MKPGEYIVLGFVTVMIIIFFSVFTWYQIKRYKKWKMKSSTHNFRSQTDQEE